MKRAYSAIGEWRHLHTILVNHAIKVVQGNHGQAVVKVMGILVMERNRHLAALVDVAVFVVLFYVRQSLAETAGFVIDEGNDRLALFIDEAPLPVFHEPG